MTSTTHRPFLTTLFGTALLALTFAPGCDKDDEDDEDSSAMRNAEDCAERGDRLGQCVNECTADGDDQATCREYCAVTGEQHDVAHPDALTLESRVLSCVDGCEARDLDGDTCSALCLDAGNVCVEG